MGHAGWRRRGRGALDALDDGRVGRVDGFEERRTLHAVGGVDRDRVRTDALGDHLADDLAAVVVEADHDHRVGCRVDDCRDVGLVVGRVGVVRRVERNRGAAVGECRLERVGETGAVGVVPGEDGDVGEAIAQNELGQRGPCNASGGAVRK